MSCDHCENGWIEMDNLRFECPVCASATTRNADAPRTRAVRLAAITEEVST